MTQRRQAPIGCRSAVRKRLAAELRVDESVLTDGFRWLDEFSTEDACWLLGDLSELFISPGLSFGAGQQVFPEMLEPQLLYQIATVGGLIAYLEQQTAVANSQSR